MENLEHLKGFEKKKKKTGMVLAGKCCLPEFTECKGKARIFITVCACMCVSVCVRTGGIYSTVRIWTADTVIMILKIIMTVVIVTAV